MSLSIIAGPCSIDQKNIEEIYQISDIKINNKPVILGTRVVGLKSRTSIDQNGNGMGMDYKTIMENQEILHKGGSINDLKSPPSIKLASEIINKTNILISTEVMMPMLQIPPLTKHIPDNKLLLWNPSVNQLGWPLMQMTKFAKKHNWKIGIKNGKWIGEGTQKANSPDYQGQTPMEKTWAGLTEYTKFTYERPCGSPSNTLPNANIILIHRGVDVPDKQNYRNLPVHELAKRTKKATNCQLYFDPSHSYGPKMRNNIVDETIKAMKLKMAEDTYLYDGILIEAGTSQTDSEQHITLNELQYMTEQLAQFRKIKTR